VETLPKYLSIGISNILKN